MEFLETLDLLAIYFQGVNLGSLEVFSIPVAPCITMAEATVAISIFSFGIFNYFLCFSMKPVSSLPDMKSLSSISLTRNPRFVLTPSTIYSERARDILFMALSLSSDQTINLESIGS